MRSLRLAAAALALCLLGTAPAYAQEQPLSAGSEGVPVPKKKKHVQPEYPPEALSQGIRGIVILDLVIDPQGRVAEVNVIRSIPGLDEAAVTAARQWEYQPTRIDGQPVSVRLTVPITFALKLPDVSKQAGIPELRQGVTPKWPEGGGPGGRATADVTLDPDGRIGVARILEGEEPWSSALLQALRTWRFGMPPGDVILSFRVEADFIPGDRDAQRVALRLTGLREAETLAGPAEEPTERAALEPPRAELPDSEGDTEPAGGNEAVEEGGPSEQEIPTGRALPQEGEDERVPPEAPEKPARVAQATPAAPPPAPPPEPSGSVPATPVAPASEPAVSLPEGDSSTPGGSEVDLTAPPPIEVITAAPPPLPPESGISALEGVTLEPGVPDLIRGRRPVAPPLARMARASGEVQVDFSVGAGGVTVAGEVRGPEVLQPAARAAVETWTFRRTRADRLYLTAVFTYDGDAARAVVFPQPAP